MFQYPLVSLYLCVHILPVPQSADLAILLVASSFCHFGGAAGKCKFSMTGQTIRGRTEDDTFKFSYRETLFGK